MVLVAVFVFATDRMIQMGIAFAKEISDGPGDG